MAEKITSVLLTGPPGVGKTTAVKKVYSILQKHQIKCAGFYTEEVRADNGVRIGFDIVSLDGKRAFLARESPNDNIWRPHVGKYSVFIKEFEDIALPVLKETSNKLLIIDEIGKMELLSNKFKEQIVKTFGSAAILATIPDGRRQTIDIVERFKASKTTKVFEISKKNRNEIIDVIFENVRQIIF